MSYMTEREGIPWEWRRDAETLTQANAIRNDPERLRNARRVMQMNADEANAALKGVSPAPLNAHGRSNKATIQRLKVSY